MIGMRIVRAAFRVRQLSGQRRPERTSARKNAPAINGDLTVIQRELRGCLRTV